MCLAVIALNTRPDLPLLIVANRDEYHARPSAPAQPWADHPDLCAGQDLSAGGTWLGVTRSGRYGLLTNFRSPAHIIADAPSRGALVLDYLTDSHDPVHHAQSLVPHIKRYNGFNLLIGDASGCALLANRSNEPVRSLDSGLYGLSNHLLDTPWPKLTSLRAAVAQTLAAPQLPDTATWLNLLADRTQPDDDALPDTGVGLDRERMLAPVFITGEHYGTRCSTVIAIHADRSIVMHERRFGPFGKALGDKRWTYQSTQTTWA